MSWLSDIFGGGQSKSPDISFEQIPELAEITKARDALLALATGQLPTVPTRGIAPLPARTEERTLARETAKKSLVPTEQEDFMNLPEVQGLIHETVTQGNLLANRLGRALQSAGAFTSTTGRDVLGRAVTDVQKSISSTLAPFASEQRGRAATERQRIQNLIPVLEGLGLTEEERERTSSQSVLDALFNQQTTQAFLPFTLQSPILQAILGGPQPSTLPVISGGTEPSIFSQLAPLLGPLLTGILG